MWPFKQTEHKVFVYGSGISEASFLKSGIKYKYFEVINVWMPFRRVFTMPSIYGTGTYCTLIPDTNQNVFGALVTMDGRSYRKYVKREKNYKVIKTTGIISRFKCHSTVAFTTVININQPTTRVQPNPNYIRVIRNALPDEAFFNFMMTSYMGDKESYVWDWYKNDGGEELVDKTNGDY